MNRHIALPVLGLTALASAGCQPPPPAPEGLDDSTRYMVREFYKNDAVFQAGVQGFMNWFFEEGYTMVGREATLEDSDAFTIGDLTWSDIDYLPLADEGQDLAEARGVVSLAEMDCSWTEAEAYLLRPDQDVVFSGDWEGYERTYRSDPDVFSQGSATGVFAPISQDLEPFSTDFPADDYGSTLMLTENMADPSAVLTADMDAYPMHLDLRHGVFDIEGEPTGVLAILTYITEAHYGPAGAAGLIQSYSVEINVQRPGDRTLRMLAVWAEPYSSVDLGDAVILTYAVNKSLDSSNRLSEICAGDVTLPE